MLERFLARVKMMGLVLMFLAPVAAAAWDKSLDDFFAHNQRYEAPVTHATAASTEVAASEMHCDVQP